jgi:hypothetical protein
MYPRWENFSTIIRTRLSFYLNSLMCVQFDTRFYYKKYIFFRLPFIKFFSRSLNSRFYIIHLQTFFRHFRFAENWFQLHFGDGIIEADKHARWCTGTWFLSDFFVRREFVIVNYFHLSLIANTKSHSWSFLY